MVYKKGTDLEKNIKIQLIYLLSKHTYIGYLSAKLCFCPISSFKL